ncbi:MAG TPA: peptidoglycan DD-metalloendopeptidase family protein [Rhodoferax sp.]|jgi:lipoprotein NlpD|nr:peptidoglycan DD-metalloendopeptidase family protein [Rhodoferax sp.]HQC85387.1 peptidoglycan DD-metalloendopeptidase family protein [Rhodoferax sp.]
MSGLLRRGSCLLAVGGALLLVGCGSKSLNRAPVEDRGNAVGAPASPDTRPQVARQLPGFENAGKPGYYTVKPGDTLIRIGLETGQSHKDISRWNALENPNRIEVGQVIRVAPPATETAAVVARPISSGTVVSTAIPVGAPAKAASAPASAPVAPAPVAAASSATGEDNLGWIWPGNGQVLAGFDEVKNKGVDIGGALGDPVLAAAEGKVVYAGSGLRGYGNLIILKHNNTYLTAYAHNKSLLVKEDQTVKKGQKIAEMGDSDADRVKLHFEVRRQGKPVDPSKYLPAR